jgi:hypothetical protein
MANWRDGQLGALQMGVRHGLYCLGSCWALMCVLFVVGVMNLVWVATLTGFVLLEKIGPGGRHRHAGGGRCHGARRDPLDPRRRSEHGSAGPGRRKCQSTVDFLPPLW